MLPTLSYIFSSCSGFSVFHHIKVQFITKTWAMVVWDACNCDVVTSESSYDAWCRYVVKLATVRHIIESKY